MTTTPEAYVQLSNDNTFITFYYDTLRDERYRESFCSIWGIAEAKQMRDIVGDLTWVPAWAGTRNSHKTTISSAVFDASFRDFRPTTTARWFQYFPRLKSIEGLEHLNTSQVKNMRKMFLGCHALTSLDLSSFDTSNVTDMRDMFQDCKSLISLDLSSFDTSKVTDTGAMFWNCSSLTALDLSSFDTSNVTKMSYMFFCCNSLTSIDLSSFDTSEVRYMYKMFVGCSALASLDLSSFDTSKVTDMKAMFSGCSALASLDLSSFDTSEVTTMEDMFKDCKGLIMLDLSCFNASFGKKVNSMFSGCESLTTIYCNSTWYGYRYYAESMFAGCTSLKGAVSYNESKTDSRMANPKKGYFTKKVQDKPKVTIPEAYVALSLDQTTLTFYYDDQLKSRKEKTWDINEKQKFLFFFDGIDPVWKSVKTITKMVLDASFKNYTPTNIKDWFKNCKTLKTIEGLQFLNTSQVEDMSEMFLGCHALTSLDLSGFDTSQVKDMNNMFGACHELTSLNLSGFDTSKVTNMSSMFWECGSLTTLNLSHFNTSNVTDMSLMFSEFGKLTSLNVSSFDTSKVEDMNCMFMGCDSLTTIYCNSSWRCRNSEDMFAGCISLKGAVAYDRLKTDISLANPERGYFSKK